MTEEERQKIIANLRDDASDWTTSGRRVRVRLLCDEIERLADENKRLKRRLEGLESEIVCMSADLIR